MSDTGTARRVSRRWPVISAAVALSLVILLGVLIVYRGIDKPFGFELEWMEEIVEDRNPVWTFVALAFNYLGGGVTAIVVVPLVIIGGLLLWRRPWAALYFAIAILASVLVVQLVKKTVGRDRPDDMLVSPDFGSFPSGHSANAALIATALGIIFWRTGCGSSARCTRRR